MKIIIILLLLFFPCTSLAVHDPLDEITKDICETHYVIYLKKDCFFLERVIWDKKDYCAVVIKVNIDKGDHWIKGFGTNLDEAFAEFYSKWNEELFLDWKRNSRHSNFRSGR